MTVRITIRENHRGILFLQHCLSNIFSLQKSKEYLVSIVRKKTVHSITISISEVLYKNATLCSVIDRIIC